MDNSNQTKFALLGAGYFMLTVVFLGTIGFVYTQWKDDQVEQEIKELKQEIEELRTELDRELDRESLEEQENQDTEEKESDEETKKKEGNEDSTENASTDLEKDLVEAGDKLTSKSYFNAFFGFSIEFPAESNVCLNDFCMDAEGADIQHVAITNDKFREEIVSQQSGLVLFEITPVKNLLGMSAVEFGKRNYGWIDQYSDHSSAVEGNETKFAGQNAFGYIAKDGFEERGAVFYEEGVRYDDSDLETAGRGSVLETPHQVYYFDKDGYLYRVIYPVNSSTAQKIIKSFRFL